MILRLLLLTFGLVLPLGAQSSPQTCQSSNPISQQLCEHLISDGIPKNYINHFFHSNLSTKSDKTTARLIQPKMILHHRSKEKQANENLHASQLPTLKAHVIAYQKVYDRVEAVYGVNREVIAAILLKETQLGHIKLTHDAFVTLNTIIKTLPSTTDRNKRLLNMAKNNISALIHYCHDNDIAPKACQFQSSYAGAVGIAQFMPQNFQYVKAYDKGLGDLNKMEDAIASVANYLYQRVGFDTLIEWDRLNDIKNIETAWDHYSHNNEYATFIKIDYPQERDHCFACERDDLNYINQQMIKILDYNNTDNYALGVLSLGYALHQQLRK